MLPPAASANVRRNSFLPANRNLPAGLSSWVPALSPSIRFDRRPQAPAQKRLPRIVFDYIDGRRRGRMDARANCRAFREVMLRPRSAVRVAGRRTSSTTILGTPLALPFLLAPIGSSRMFYPRAEGLPRTRRGRLEPPTSSRRCPAAGSKMSGRVRPAHSGISFTSLVDAMRRLPASSEPAVPVIRRSSSPSTLRSRVCASVTSATGLESCLARTSGRGSRS